MLAPMKRFLVLLVLAAVAHAQVTTAYTVDANHIGGSGGGHSCTGNTCNFTYNPNEVPTDYKYPWADPAVDDYLVEPDDCIK